MKNRFEGKVIAIAGGAGGIGTACSQRFAAEGAAVMVGDINIEDAESVVAKIKAAGGRATAFKLSLGEEASIIDFIETTVKLYGGLDGFHANASDSSRNADDRDIVTMSMETYDYYMDVNTRGFFMCSRYAIPHLIKRGGGAMLYTSSNAAYYSDNVRPVYSMGKNAVHGMSRYIANKYGKQGVRSNVISPGTIVHARMIEHMGQAFVDEMIKQARTPRVGTPDDIAATAAFLLSDEAGFITGHVINVDGGKTMRA